MLGDQAFGDAEEVHLGVIGVADGRTGEDLGGAGHVGEGIREETAGAGLGQGDGLLKAAQLFDDERGEAGVAGGDEIFADRVTDLARDFAQLVGGRAAAGRRDAGIDDAGVRAEGEGHAGGDQRSDDSFERDGADPERAHLHVGFALASAPDLTETRHDFLFEHRPELERRTREHDKRAVFAMEEDAGRGAARIGQRLSAGRDVALAEVGGGDLAADHLETLTQGLLSGGHMLENESESAGDGFARMVVGGRPDAAGGDDEVVGAPGFADGAGDFGGVVPDDEGAGDRQPAAGEMLT